MRVQQRARITLLKVMFIACLVVMTISSGSIAGAQTREHDTSDRKLVSRVEPEYPETLKRLYIGGVVRIQVTVDASGKVESTELLGGSPILGQSAMKAVKQWKYMPAASTEKFVVQLEFDPHR